MNKRGFTMIEVIVVTLIIATLALIVAPSFKNSTLTSNIEKAKVGLVELGVAARLYYEMHPGSTQIQGLLRESQFSALTPTEANDEQGYTYLRNKSRWSMRVNGTDYTLAGLNCKYSIGEDKAQTLVSAECLFRDDDEQEDCYLFTIERNNPALVKRSIGVASCENM